MLSLFLLFAPLRNVKKKSGGYEGGIVSDSERAEKEKEGTAWRVREDKHHSFANIFVDCVLLPSVYTPLSSAQSTTIKVRPPWV